MIVITKAALKSEAAKVEQCCKKHTLYKYNIPRFNP